MNKKTTSKKTKLGKNPIKTDRKQKERTLSLKQLQKITHVISGIQEVQFHIVTKDISKKGLVRYFGNYNFEILSGNTSGIYLHSYSKFGFGKRQVFESKDEYCNYLVKLF